MPRAQRLDDVTCIICMDELFNQRDELDEVAPIATPDCGMSTFSTARQELIGVQDTSSTSDV